MVFCICGDPPNLGDFPPFLSKIPRGTIPTLLSTALEIHHQHDLYSSHGADFCADRELRFVATHRLHYTQFSIAKIMGDIYKFMKNIY